MATGLLLDKRLSGRTLRDSRIVVDAATKGRVHNQRKTHCPRGHEYDAMSPSHQGVARRCRKCTAASARKSRARKKTTVEI